MKKCISCGKELSKINPNKKCFNCISRKIDSGLEETEKKSDVSIEKNSKSGLNKKILIAIEKNKIKKKKELGILDIEEEKITKKFLYKVSLELKK